MWELRAEILIYSKELIDPRAPPITGTVTGGTPDGVTCDVDVQTQIALGVLCNWGKLPAVTTESRTSRCARTASTVLATRNGPRRSRRRVNAPHASLVWSVDNTVPRQAACVAISAVSASRISLRA
jgi:hypothetical protein